MTCECPTFQGFQIHWDCCPTLRAHRQKVEDFIKSNATAAGVDTTDIAEVKRRCMLHQTPGLLTLVIDGQVVASMPDIVNNVAGQGKVDK